MIRLADRPPTDRRWLAVAYLLRRSRPGAPRLMLVADGIVATACASVLAGRSR